MFAAENELSENTTATVCSLHGKVLHLHHKHMGISIIQPTVELPFEKHLTVFHHTSKTTNTTVFILHHILIDLE